jgi:hypothetical protein
MGPARLRPKAAPVAVIVAALLGACTRATRMPSVDASGGAASAASASVATAPDAELTDVTALGASGDLVCGLLANGSVWCWTGSCDQQPSVAQRMTPPGFAPAADVTVGPCFSCARMRAGAVACWDDGGAPAVVDAIPLPGSVAKVVVAPQAAFARLEDGRILTWTATEAGFTRASATDLRQLPNVGVGWRGSCHRKSTDADWWEACQKDEHGAVRCQGSGGSAGGMNTTFLKVSDAHWRAVPWLSGATDVGADQWCGWGLIAPDLVRRDCVYGVLAGDWACPEMDACPISKKWTYDTADYRFLRVLSEYRFPGIRRLVDDFVGLDDSGQCLRFDGHRLVPAATGRYLDMVYAGAFYGLRTDGKVRQFCGRFPEGDGTPVLARAP